MRTIQVIARKSADGNSADEAVAPNARSGAGLLAHRGVTNCSSAQAERQFGRARGPPCPRWRDEWRVRRGQSQPRTAELHPCATKVSYT
jgi:hypothetical protein